MKILPKWYTFQVESGPFFNYYIHSIGETIYEIWAEETQITLKYAKSGKNIGQFSTENPNTNKEKLKSIEKHLFYTQVSNYSLYAYNSNDLYYEYTKSLDCWINGVFHKNDGYQTPIVLHPWRDKGIIHVNNESLLSKQRLISLFSTQDESIDSIRWINGNQFVRYLKISSTNFNKLSNITLSRFFKNTVDLDKLSLQEKDIKDIAMPLNSLTPSYIRKNHLRPLQILSEWLQKDGLSIVNYAFDYLLETLGEVEVYEAPNVDFANYLRSVEKIEEEIRNSDTNTDLADEITKLLASIYNTNLSRFNIIQIQRLFLISYIARLWATKLDIPKLEINATIFNRETSDKYQSKILQYIIYKTIAIFEKYEPYKGKVNLCLDSNYLFESKSIQQQVLSSIDFGFNHLVEDIDKEKSHVSLKIRQSIYFFNNLNIYGNLDVKPLVKHNILKQIKQQNDQKDIYIIDLSEYTATISKNTKIDSSVIMPPPIFETDILIEQYDLKGQSKNAFTLLSQLSSGERQLLNSVSSAIYHLRNLNSVADSSDLIKYKYINLFFEEVELYFHPEFQKNYIKYLLDNIDKVDLSNLDSINLCFVTHSPFILSDIPACNILKLKEGKTYIPPSKYVSDNKETFAENIHELLAHEFFFNEGAFMGNFAKQKIESLISYLTCTNSELRSDWNEEKAKQTIRVIGETIIQEQLWALFFKNEKFRYSKRELLEKQIKELEYQINQLS